MPIGHCCYDICGAVIHIEKPENYDTPFNLRRVEKIIDQILRPTYPKTSDKVPEFIHTGCNF